MVVACDSPSFVLREVYMREWATPNWFVSHTHILADLTSERPNDNRAYQYLFLKNKRVKRRKS